MNRHLLHSSLVAVALAFASCNESASSHYATAATARADGAIERGWLPAALPDSAFDIVESHNLDTNTGGGSFHFDARDSDSFGAQLGSLSAEQSQNRVKDHAKLQHDGYTFHTAPGFTLAVNWQKRHVQFWIDHKSK